MMPPEPDDEQIEYRVKQDEKKFQINNSSGRTILVFRDLGSAEQYASLLNQAFLAGYKSGYREGRKP